MRNIFAKRKSPNSLTFGAKILVKAAIVLVTLCCVLPFIMILSASFSDEMAIKVAGVGFFPKDFSLEAYRFILQYPEEIVNAYAISL